jgi:hypothetical protein
VVATAAAATAAPPGAPLAARPEAMTCFPTSPCPWGRTGWVQRPLSCAATHKGTPPGQRHVGATTAGPEPRV